MIMKLILTLVLYGSRCHTTYNPFKNPSGHEIELNQYHQATPVVKSPGDDMTLKAVQRLKITAVYVVSLWPIKIVRITASIIIGCSLVDNQFLALIPGPVKWLRKSEPSEAFDLGFDTILIDGHPYAEIREENVENDHFPQIYTFRKRKCEIISKLHFEHTSPVETGQYLCYTEPKVHQRFNVNLIESKVQESYFMEILLSSVLLISLVVALIITIFQGRRRPRLEEQNQFL